MTSNVLECLFVFDMASYIFIAGDNCNMSHFLVFIIFITSEPSKGFDPLAKFGCAWSTFW